MACRMYQALAGIKGEEWRHVVHIHTSSAALAAVCIRYHTRQKKIKIILSIHDTSFEREIFMSSIEAKFVSQHKTWQNDTDLLQWENTMIVDYISQAVSAVTVLTESMYDYYMNHAYFLREKGNKGELHVVGNGVPPDLGLKKYTSNPLIIPGTKLAAKDTVTKLILSNKRYTHIFLFVGRIEQNKASLLPLLLPYLKRVHAALILMGPILNQDIFFKLNSSSHSEDIYFVNEEMQKDYGEAVRTAADICIIPSLSEGFGLLVPECLSYGSFAIASDTSGLHDVCIDHTFEPFTRLFGIYKEAGALLGKEHIEKNMFSTLLDGILVRLA
eukprot:jgi/Picre1/32239/NNA_007585.t1